MRKFVLLLLLFSVSLFPSFAPAPLYSPIASVHPISETVYVTKTGSKYHRGTCHHLRKSKIRTTKSEAKNNGYTACSHCKP
ncbi:MAG TPA: hypothetical protein VKX40_00500 [Aequorivita sp.]|nr:hypothetical protein [Aequorivita sp.]